MLYNSKSSNTNNVFFLSSSSYSLTLGQSYESNKDIVLGQLDTNAANTYPCYQNNTGNFPTTLYTATPSVDPSNSLTYTIYISSGKINGSVTNGTITGTFSAEIAKTFSFDTIGFSIDGASGNAGVKNISISVIPEPTTATLSLLALAGLAARRRRK